MKKAMHPIVNTEIQRLSANEVEAWEERAAILEFEAGHARELAEALALVLLLAERSRSGPLRSAE